LVSGYDRVFLELNTGTPESALADIRDDPDALRQRKLRRTGTRARLPSAPFRL